VFSIEEEMGVCGPFLLVSLSGEVAYVAAALL
jgi:hypothetical protein